MFRIPAPGLVLLIVAASTSQAWANHSVATWVRHPTAPTSFDRWIDAASIEIKDGFAIYLYKDDHGGEPSPEVGGSTGSLNCATGEEYYYDESKQRWTEQFYSDESSPAALGSFICNR
jgi:hypothetical protein